MGTNNTWCPRLIVVENVQQRTSHDKYAKAFFARVEFDGWLITMRAVALIYADCSAKELDETFYVPRILRDDDALPVGRIEGQLEQAVANESAADLLLGEALDLLQSVEYCLVPVLSIVVTASGSPDLGPYKCLIVAHPLSLAQY